MIPIIIDATTLPFGVASNKNLIEKVVDSIIKDITASLFREWDQQAIQGLHQTRKRYRDNLFVVDEGRMMGSVVLDYSIDPMVRMIEEGANAFQMQEGFAKSSKKKMKAGGGWYLTIPFRFATPEAVAESSVFSGKMPDEIHDIVKNKPLEINIMGGGQRSVGLKIDEIPNQYKEAIPESEAFKSIYQGMIKVQDPTTKDNTYMNFRRVSDKSDVSSWVHPGLDTRDFGEKALAKIDQNMDVELNRAMNKILAALGF